MWSGTLERLFASETAPGFLWASKAEGGMSVNGDEGIDVKLDAAGNAYVAGNFTADIRFGGIILTNTGGYNFFVSKFDTAGKPVWAKAINGGLSTEPRLASDESGNSYVLANFRFSASFGNLTLTNNGEGSVFVAKYSPDGELAWVKHATGGSSTYGNVACDSVGNVIFSGVFGGSINFAGSNFVASSGELFEAKMTSAGDLVWLRQATTGSHLYGQWTAVDAGGNAFLAGVFEDTVKLGALTVNAAVPGRVEIFLAKLDSNGTPLWAKDAGQADTSIEALAVDPEGHSVIAGSFGATASFGGVTLTNNGNSQMPDAFLTKYDSDGNVIWVRQIAGPGGDRIRALTADVSGNIYVTGRFGDYGGGFASFGGTNLVAGSSGDIGPVFIGKYNPNGDVIWVTAARSTKWIESRGIAVGGNQDCLLTGGFRTMAAFGGNKISGSASNTYSEIFLAKLAGYLTDSPPVITVRPADQVAYAGDSAILSVEASGGDLLNYQWQKNGTNILGATNATLLLFPARSDDTGEYRVVIGNDYGSITSPAAEVEVRPSNNAPGFLWARRDGGFNYESVSGIAAGIGGRIYLTGRFYGTSSFDGTNVSAFSGEEVPDLFVAQYNALGNFNWIRATGSSFADYGIAVAGDGAGNAYVTGYVGAATQSGDISLTNSGCFLSKYDAAGELQWASPVPGRIQDSAADATGHSVVVGWFSSLATFGSTNLATSGPGDADIFVAKYDSDGTLVWVRSAGGMGSDSAYSVALDKSGDIFLIGSVSSAQSAFGGLTYTNTGYFLAKYDGAGSAIWVHPAELGTIASDGYGNVYLSASGVTKFDSAGAEEWFRPKTNPTLQSQLHRNLAVDDSGNVFVAERFSNTVSVGGFAFDPVGTSDVLISLFDRSGNFIGARQASGAFGVVSGLAIDESNNIYISGSFGDGTLGVTVDTALRTANFGSTTLQCSGFGDLFLAKLAAAPPALNIVQNQNQLLVSWPATSGDFALEKAATIGTAEQWSPVSSSIVTNGDFRRVTIPILDRQEFYHLRRN